MKAFPSLLRCLGAGVAAGALALVTAQPLAAEPPPTATPAYVVTPALRQALEQPRYFNPVDPESDELLSRKRWRRGWIASWAAFAVVNVLDTHSSAGKGELNPLLRAPDGRFSTQRAGIFKAGLGGGLMAFQGWMIKTHPERNMYKPFTVANFGVTGAMGAVAARNYTID